MMERSSVVLCVEDDLDTQEMLRVLICAQGYGFEVAGTRADALRLIQEKEIALVLLDNMLPDGNGVELCRQVREFDKQLPIIFVSGSAHEDERLEALGSGANAFLTKPLALDKLFATLNDYAPIRWRG
ncbi:MAG TPA: response regulator [Blastocatellia bacterium]|nr:response regulator [Blastocatellia bacterium]